MSRSAGSSARHPVEHRARSVPPLGAGERDQRPDDGAVVHALQPLERLRLGAEHEPGEVLAGVELGPVAPRGPRRAPRTPSARSRRRARGSSAVGGERPRTMIAPGGDDRRAARGARPRRTRRRRRRAARRDRSPVPRRRRAAPSRRGRGPRGCARRSGRATRVSTAIATPSGAAASRSTAPAGTRRRRSPRTRAARVQPTRARDSTGPVSAQVAVEDHPQVGIPVDDVLGPEPADEGDLGLAERRRRRRAASRGPDRARRCRRWRRAPPPRTDRPAPRMTT